MSGLELVDGQFASGQVTLANIMRSGGGGKKRCRIYPESAGGFQFLSRAAYKFTGWLKLVHEGLRGARRACAQISNASKLTASRA